MHTNGHHASPLTFPIFDRVTLLVLMAGWVFYIVFAPVYIFRSGYPQPADFIIAITAGLSALLFLVKQKMVFNRVFAILCLMVGLFFIINISYFTVYGDTRFLLASTYYIFNALVFSGTIILFKQNPLLLKKYACMAIAASIVFELFWIKFLPSNSEFRQTGSFNNPNQLGYWSLLSASYLIILSYGERMKWYVVIGFLICGYIATLSLSRAVIFSYGLILLAFFIGPYVSFLTKLAIAVFVSGYSLAQIAVFENPAFLIDNLAFLERVIDRLDTVQTEGVDSIAERGYARIFENPQYLFYGSGEGSYWRFASERSHGIELHSGLGTILFAYGFLGFILFSAFVLTIFQRAPILLWLTLAAIMAYGITHQHVRFTGFWVYMGLVYAMTRYVIPHRVKASSHHPQSHHPRSLTKTNEGQTISHPA
jgi:hypothetical protein